MNRLFNGNEIEIDDKLNRYINLLEDAIATADFTDLLTAYPDFLDYYNPNKAYPELRKRQKQKKIIRQYLKRLEYAVKILMDQKIE